MHADGKHTPELNQEEPGEPDATGCYFLELYENDRLASEISSATFLKEQLPSYSNSVVSSTMCIRLNDDNVRAIFFANDYSSSKWSIISAQTASRSHKGPTCSGGKSSFVFYNVTLILRDFNHCETDCE